MAHPYFYSFLATIYFVNNLITFFAAHGSLCNPDWINPRMTKFVDFENRPGYLSVKAHEFEDEPEVLQAKIKLLAELIKKSKNMITYTGAGISVAAGIPDYASDGTGGEASYGGLETEGKVDLLKFQPTFAHRALTSLHKEGYLKHWVQQNHDGLPQKAGFPQKDMNEIHGSWFDPSNNVVPMSGMLRTDLVALREEWTEKTDFVLVLGTSLAGMSTDRMVVYPSQKASKGDGLGSCIISIQQTPLDNISSLRIFSKLETVFQMLAKEMNLKVADQIKLQPPIKDIFLVPYLRTGKRIDSNSEKEKTKPSPLLKLDLSTGAKLIQVHGQYKGAMGVCLGRNEDGHWLTEWEEVEKVDGAINVNTVVRLLGCWWGDVLERGEVETMPIKSR